MSRYLIGIDLGTTNTRLRMSMPRAPRGGKPNIQTFQVPQLVNAGELGRKPLLPSFLYLPGPHDLPAGSTKLPWNDSPPDVIGEFARNHGGRIPGRLVTSAKSWLCHSGVDRTAPLLPWAAPPEVERLSPLEVSARYLRHMVAGWNQFQARGDDEKLEKQAIVLTVPASFDDVARNLTMEAAKLAGMENVTLLEEPQAAFYCWLATASRQRNHAIEARHALPRGGCGRRHQRLQPDPRRRGKGRTFLHSRLGRRSPVARWRQHGSGRRQGGRGETARRRQARRGPVWHAGASLSQRQGSVAAAQSAGDFLGHDHGPRAIGHWRRDEYATVGRRRAPDSFRRLFPRDIARRRAPARRPGRSA